MSKHTQKYLTLREASKITPYQQEYLSLLARRKQIKAIKINRKWHTTEQWLNAYLKVYHTDKLIETQEEKEERIQEEQKQKNKETKKQFLPLLSLATVITLILIITSFIMLQSKETHVAETNFIPKERTTLTDENGNIIIQETGTRVLGVETLREE